MNRKRAFFVMALALVIVLAPVAASAAIVPTTCSGADCQACNIVDLLQSVINFAIGLSIPIAMGLFAWAGVLYFTSATNLHNIDHAKKIFSSALIGFVVALGAYLIVETILHAILNPTYFAGWNKVDCVKKVDRLTTGTISGLLTEILGNNPSSITIVNNTPSGPVCAEGSTYSSEFSTCITKGCADLSSSSCFSAPTYINTSSTGGQVLGQDALTAKIRNTYQYASVLQQQCVAQGYGDCSMARAVMAIESSGRATVISSAGCVGLMQICPATAQGLDPSLRGLSYSQITTKLQDPAYNMQLGVQYLKQLQNQFGDPALVAAAYNGGAKANTASKTCSGQTYWQCTANGGYAETRAYVPNVTTARSLIAQ